MIRKIYIAIFLLNALICYGFAQDPKPENIDLIKKAIVTIDTRISSAAYLSPGQWTGTGFIADREKGYIITNSHVVGRAAIGSYFVTFHNGQQAEAKLAYYDPYVDFAILKVEKNVLPQEISAIEFATTEPKIGDSVFIVGNTEGQGFSFHSGYLSDLYDINGEMPQGTYIINMNSTGGASGSPIINSQNKAIGILYGGGKTHSLALKQGYIQHALQNITIDKPVTRQHIGAITTLYSLDKAVKHRNFPREEMLNYIQQYPDSRNRAIIVRNTIKGSTAENILQAGDIIWKVNGQQVHADLHLFDNLMNSSKDQINIQIYRQGQEITKKINLYDLNKTKINIMFDFAGATFFQADDYYAISTGVTIGSVVATNIQSGSSFSVIPEMYNSNYKNVYRLCLLSINDDEITDINSLIKIAPEAIKHKYINVKYYNFQPYVPSFNGGVFNYRSGHEILMQDILFDSIDTQPRILKFDNTKLEWDAHKI